MLQTISERKIYIKFMQSNEKSPAFLVRMYTDTTTSNNWLAVKYMPNYDLGIPLLDINPGEIC